MGKSKKQRQDAVNLEVVHPNAAGIDIGNATHYVAVPPDRDAEPVRSFCVLHRRFEENGRLAGTMPHRHGGAAIHRCLLATGI